MALWWTNRSLPPSSGVMNPYPLSALNHFTVPVAIRKTPPPLLRNGQRRRNVRIRYSLRSPGSVAAVPLTTGPHARLGGGDPTNKTSTSSARRRLSSAGSPCSEVPSLEPTLGPTKPAAHVGPGTLVKPKPDRSPHRQARYRFWPA